MMTLREAKQRLALSNMHISRVIHSAPQEYSITFAEAGWREAETSAYYTDDLEDAALTGALMRRDKQRSA